MKYVLDENLTVADHNLPKGVINARELFFQNGYRSWGVSDQKLLKLATKEGYTIITQDSKFIIRANQQNVDIIFAIGRAGKKWFYIPKDARVSNRLKLRNFIDPEMESNPDEICYVRDLNEIPINLKKGSNKIDKNKGL